MRGYVNDRLFFMLELYFEIIKYISIQVYSTLMI